jgi:hypothetical protein
MEAEENENLSTVDALSSRSQQADGTLSDLARAIESRSEARRHQIIEEIAAHAGDRTGLNDKVRAEGDDEGLVAYALASGWVSRFANDIARPNLQEGLINWSEFHVAQEAGRFVSEHPALREPLESEARLLLKWLNELLEAIPSSEDSGAQDDGGKSIVEVGTPTGMLLQFGSKR